MRPAFRASLLAALACLGAAAALPPAAAGVPYLRHSVAPASTDRIIVKWRDSGVAATQIDSAEGRAQQLRAIAGVDVTVDRNLYGHTDLLRLDHQPSASELRATLAQLRLDPSVEYAEPDGVRFIQGTITGTPNDPHFSAGSDGIGSWNGQWYLQPSSSTTPAAIGATTAWHTTTGSPSVVVAVIDTGIIAAHPDLAANLLPGYDFVSCDQGNNASGATNDCSASGSAATYYFANDGDGWDADPSDPGDWIDTTDTGLALFQNNGCTTALNSSWHGTKVAGVIGAIANNNLGIVGIAPATRLLPVRVVGRCVGRVSDIAAAIRWAAGLPVTGVPANANPAKIINLSLGAATACSATEQSAVTAAIAAGALVVAAAGNDGGPVDAPASCTGVLSVAGLRHDGTKVGYSSVSSSLAAVGIAAPGGNCVNVDSTGVTVGVTVPCVYSIETASDEGSTGPSATPGFYTYAQLSASYVAGGGSRENTANVGTSFATPMVSGTAALMLAANPSLSPAQLMARLQSSALPFPTAASGITATCALAATTTDANGFYTDTSQNNSCLCTTATCGAGMLSAANALAVATGMVAQITASKTSALAGERITVDGSGSTAASGYSLVSYQWSTDPATSDAFTDPTAAKTTFVVPTFRSITVILTITDNAGRTASSSVRITSALNTKGTGAFDPVWLLVLAAAAGWRVRRRRPHPPSAPF